MVNPAQIRPNHKNLKEALVAQVDGAISGKVLASGIFAADAE